MDARTRLGQIVDEAQAIQAKADAARRDLTEVEAAKIDALCNEFDRLEGELDTKPDATYFAKQKLRLSAAGSGRR